jgi:hypothetical protein
VSRNHHRPALLVEAGNGDVEHAVQRIQMPLDGRSALLVEDGVAGRREEVAGRNHIRAAEEHHHVAVGVRIGLEQDLDRLAVEVNLLLLREEGGRRQHLLRQLLLAFGGALHAVQRVLVGDDTGRGAAAAPAPAGRAERLDDGGVAARVIRVHVRVDDVAQRPPGESIAQRGDDALAPVGRAAVDEEDAVQPDLRDDVHVAEVEHVDIPLHRQDAHLAVGGGAERSQRRRRQAIRR